MRRLAAAAAATASLLIAVWTAFVAAVASSLLRLPDPNPFVPRHARPLRTVAVAGVLTAVAAGRCSASTRGS